MKIRSILAASVAIAISAAASVYAGESTLILLPQDEEIKLALEAGPEHLRADATVYVFGPKGYKKVRSGTNGFTCLVNRDGNQGGDNDLKPTCWDPEGSRTILPVMLRVGELIARSATEEDIRREIDAGFASGRFSSPSKAGIAYMLLGDLSYDPQAKRISGTAFPPHYMVYAPGVTKADIGMTTKHPDSKYRLPLVYAGYSGGIHTAYIIIPAAPNKDTPAS